MDVTPIGGEPPTSGVYPMVFGPHPFLREPQWIRRQLGGEPLEIMWGGPCVASQGHPFGRMLGASHPSYAMMTDLRGVFEVQVAF